MSTRDTLAQIERTLWKNDLSAYDWKLALHQQSTYPETA